MSPVQDSYVAEQSAAIAGQRADFGLVDVLSKVAEGGDINFGLAVVRGTSDGQAELPSATGQAFLGLTEYTTAWAANASDVHLYAENREMNLLDFGRIYAVCEDGCVPGDPVFFRHTAAGNEVLGALRTDADGADADQIDGATWETTASAGAIAMLQLRKAPAGVAPLVLAETITDAGATALSILTQVSLFDTTAGAQTGTLADGFEGQEKTLKMTVDGATDMVVTPANLHDGATLTFADVNDSTVLRFIGGTWMVISNNGVAIA